MLVIAFTIMTLIPFHRAAPTQLALRTFTDPPPSRPTPTICPTYVDTLTEVACTVVVNMYYYETTVIIFGRIEDSNHRLQTPMYYTICYNICDVKCQNPPNVGISCHLPKRQFLGYFDEKYHF